MTSEAYDDKNRADFEKNSEIISQCVEKIRQSNTLKPTVMELARLAGMSRNSFNKKGPRGYVHALLSEIKTNRKAKNEKKRKERQDRVSELEEKLYQCGKEVAYWFSKYDELLRNFNQLELSLSRKQETAEWYQKELQLEREKSKQLTAKLELMNNVLREQK